MSGSLIWVEWLGNIMYVKMYYGKSVVERQTESAGEYTQNKKN